VPNTALAFTALGDPTRRRVFERLARGPLPVVRISRGMGVSRPAVSQHLKVLLDAGLVSVTAEGTRNLYRINPRGVEAMRRYLDRYWDDALAAFKITAESETDA
jgi:DNA-binding transcriptional ArsR family regulator